MITIVVSCPGTGKQLWQQLQEDLSCLKPKDTPHIRCFPQQGQALVTCRFADAEPARNAQIYYVASSLTDFVVSQYEAGVLRRLIKKGYPSASEDEREAIFDEAYGILIGKSPLKLAGEARLQSKADIMYALLDYLNMEELLILDGFVRFRLWKYRRYLQHLVRMAADSIRRKRAHREFISVLKGFVDLQEPRRDIVHIVVRPNGLYRILDREFSPIETEYLEGYAATLIEHELDVEDLLISALLTTAPCRIMFHFPPEWPATDAVQSIFGPRIEHCPGCRHCEASRQAIAAILADRAEKS
ncbi:MAG: hypothetical protein GX341_07860 [Firmicutes bacterium]|nr:hypothetical protein [Bacillota bacterium]